MVSFFSNSDFPPRICCHFFRTTLFWEKLRLHTFSVYLIRHKSYFFGTAISSEQLLFSLFQNSHVFAGVIFSEQLFFRSETSTEQAFFENKKRANFSNQVLLHSSNFFRKDRFWEKLVFQKSNIPQYIPTFSRELPFYSCYFFKRRYLL